MRHPDERGIALITTLLVLMLISALLVGFTTVVISDQRYRFLDRDRGQAFYAASGGLEKLTADLGNLFYKNVAPTDSQVTALTLAANTPAIAGVTFGASVAPLPLAASELSDATCSGTGRAQRIVGTNGYTIRFCADAGNNPTTTIGSTMIQSGPYADLYAMKTPYQLDVTARTNTGGEVHLVRTVEAVAIPVFQFGIFSDVDLAFNAADDFSFGGRVHTNGNLFLAEARDSQLTINAKVTAVGEVVRQRLSNGVSIDDSGHTGTVTIANSSSSTVDMLRTWGSVVDGPASAANPLWESISRTKYNGYIRNGDTGAKPLNLPLITVGGTTPDLTRRPLAGEDPNSILFQSRLFGKASLRILLSDTAADITGLPGVTGTAPVSLETDWLATPPNNGTAYGPVNSSHPPIARTPGPTATTVNSTSSTVNTIKVASTTLFRPSMTLQGSVTQAITCTAKDLTNNRFTGCTVVTAMALPVNLVGAWGASVAVTAAVGAGTNVTIQVGSGNTNSFLPKPLIVSGGIATCTGWDATPAFTGCLGLSDAPSNNAVVIGANQQSAVVGTIGGFIKIERQAADGIWTDVTMEILNDGIGGPNLDGTVCGDPTPKAILRIQRLRDNGGGASAAVNGGGCSYNADTTGAKDASNWWPNVLYDAREAVLRDDDYPGAKTLTYNGVIHYVALDVANLAKWFRHVAPFDTVADTGANSITDTSVNGYTVYFSDRRNNRNEASQETGELGFEDIVNPGAVNGAPNGTLDAGENVNGSVIAGTTTPTQQLYGGHPSYNGVYNSLPTGSTGVNLAFPASPTLVSTLTDPQARVNRSIFFRHALKLMNGRDIRPTSTTGLTGLTIVTENPVYIQGDWNANPGGAGGFGSGTHAATAVIADAVTLLSGNWNDVVSLENPYAPAARPRTVNTWYRVAVLAGKSMIFPFMAGTSATFGTDGGAHAFLHYLEGRPGTSDTINYRGSLATFYFSRQATGTFKGNQSTVYQVPADRSFAFDTDFLTPGLLPPNTPVFRDMNAVGFSQELRPGK